jgi:hypothetical protein
MNSKENLTDYQLEQLRLLGEKLRELRLRSGQKSYENFATENGLNRANYGRYEKGANLRVSTLINILKAHNLSIEDLIKDL